MSTEKETNHWQQLLARLQRAAVALDESLGRSEARTREKLDARAKLMAYAVERVRSEDLGIEVLVFGVADQRCAIATRFVFEMLPLPAMTQLPGVNPHIAGVCSVRGQILLVVDLVQLFAFPAATTEGEPQLLILGAERPEFGVIVHSRGQAVRLPRSAVARSPELPAPALGNCASGVTSDGLLLLDGRELLKDPRLYVNQTG